MRSPSIPSIYSFSIDGEPLDGVDSFKYLGSYISIDSRFVAKVEDSLNQATRSYGRLRERVFQNDNLNLSTKVKVYEAKGFSVLLNGSEASTLYTRQMKTLDMWHIRGLKSIIGIPWRDNLTGNETLRRTSSVSLENIISRGQLRWLGHVKRMEDIRLAM